MWQGPAALQSTRPPAQPARRLASIGVRRQPSSQPRPQPATSPELVERARVPSRTTASGAPPRRPHAMVARVVRRVETPLAIARPVHPPNLPYSDGVGARLTGRSNYWLRRRRGCRREEAGGPGTRAADVHVICLLLLLLPGKQARAGPAPCGSVRAAHLLLQRTAAQAGRLHSIWAPRRKQMAVRFDRASLEFWKYLWKNVECMSDTRK